MNLGNLATAIGQRLGTNTSSASTTDGAAVRAFLTLRHDQLYRAFLWKDSVCEFETPVNPATPYAPLNNYMPSKGRVILPPMIANVLGVRLGWRSLNVQRPMLYYRADYARFFKMGYTADFSLLSSCVWEFDAVQNLGLSNANATDNNQPVTLDELASDEVSVVRNIYPLPNQVLATDRIDNFIKPVTQGNVILGIQSTQGNLVPNGTNFPVYGGAGALSVQINGFVIGAVYQYTPGTYTDGKSILTRGTELANPSPTDTVSGTFLATQASYWICAPAQPSLPPTPDSGVSVTDVIATTTINPIITLSASQTEAPKSQRIQLIGQPSSVCQKNENLHVLGKRNVPPFAADSDVPGVAGFSGILFALGYYDFKQRDDSGGSADALAALNEAVGPKWLSDGIAGGWLLSLIKEETEQAAQNTRIIPHDGFGEPGLGTYQDKSNPYWC